MLTARNGIFLGSQMEGRNYEDLSSMNVAMAQMGEELNAEIDNWCVYYIGSVREGGEGLGNRVFCALHSRM